MTLGSQPNKGFFPRIIFLLGLLAGVCLVGYAAVNLIRMPAVSPGAFVPQTIVRSESFPFGLFQLLFVLGYSFAFLPVIVMFTIKNFGDNPHALILAASLMCLSLLIEIINNLPLLGTYMYPEKLSPIGDEVLLYLSQTASIRYLSFDVAGFSLLYVSLLIYTVVYWKPHRTLGYLIIASVILFSASAPFLWISGTLAMVLMAISVVCIAPIPVVFGRIAAA